MGCRFIFVVSLLAGTAIGNDLTRHGQSPARLTFLCWEGSFTPEWCCDLHASNEGRKECWNGEFTFYRCCYGQFKINPGWTVKRRLSDVATFHTQWHQYWIAKCWWSGEFMQTVLHDRCCDTSVSPRGRADCWDAEYTFFSCCERETSHSTSAADVGMAGVQLLDDTQVKTMISQWLLEYGAGVERIRSVARHFTAKRATDDEEAIITYLRIRASKPTVVWECSPGHGYSSLYILAALFENGNGGHLHSFGMLPKEDVVKFVNSVAPSLSQLWTYHEGNFTMFLNEHSKAGSTNPAMPKYVYLDAEHSASFAEWYTTALLDTLVDHVYVSIHDFYDAGCTQVGCSELDPHQAWPEGQAVLKYLGSSARSCQHFTISEQHKPDLRLAVSNLLADYVEDERISERASNPTFWFEMNC